MQLPWIHTGVPAATAISLGRSQRQLAVHAVPARRRTSGGGAVLVGPWLLRALLVVPRSHPWLRDGPARAAQRFGDVHREWLARMGVATEPHAGPLVDHWSCFAGRAPGELLVAGRKITGIAQTWRRRRALLWSGTLLGPPPWQLLADALDRPAHTALDLAASAANAQDLLRIAPDAGTWARTLRDALSAAMADGAAVQVTARRQ